jgi:hypothetical protein
MDFIYIYIYIALIDDEGTLVNLVDQLLMSYEHTRGSLHSYNLISLQLNMTTCQMLELCLNLFKGKCLDT